MEKTIVSNQSVQSLVMIFAEFFKFPEEEFFLEIKRGEIDAQVSELSLLAGFPITTCFKKKIETYEQFVESFDVCFLGKVRPFAPPIESVYKQWTTDESFQVPFKKQKGYLMGDSAFHIRHILHSLHLEIPVEYDLRPDHLTLLLELFAYLLGQELLQEAKQFKNDHLDWLPEFQTALAQIPKGKIYGYVVSQLEDFLKKFEP